MINLVFLIAALTFDNGLCGFVSPKAFWYQHGHKDTRILMDRCRIGDKAGYLYFDQSCLLYFVIVVAKEIRLDHLPPRKVLLEHPIVDLEEAWLYFPFITGDTYGICF